MMMQRSEILGFQALFAGKHILIGNLKRRQKGRPGNRQHHFRDQAGRGRAPSWAPALAFGPCGVDVTFGTQTDTPMNAQYRIQAIRSIDKQPRIQHNLRGVVHQATFPVSSSAVCQSHELAQSRWCWSSHARPGDTRLGRSRSGMHPDQ
jgi:hypothetical protein